MDHLKFTTIAHHDHVICSPLSEAKVDRVLALLELAPGEPVIDVGCGKAEFLIRLVERYGVRAVGFDLNPAFITDGWVRAKSRIPSGDFTLQQADIASFVAQPGSFAAALCIGSTQAYGGYRPALQALAKLVRPGGQVLVGDGYWKRPPDPDYLAFLGAAPDEMLSHAENVSAGLEAGLAPLYAAVSNADEWDHYEGLYARAAERYAMRQPQDPDTPAIRQRIRAWREAYLKWGRDTMGFGLYLFMKE